MVELQRNPSGAVDKRCRATLRPMSKNRRDSSVCELEQRLRDVKSTNCRFRKALIEREAELQALIRKLGPEARNWLDGNCGGVGGAVIGSDTEPLTINKEQSRLSVPPIRRDLPSATETTDLTSIGSCNSTHDNHTTNNTTLQTKKIIQQGMSLPIEQLNNNNSVPIAKIPLSRLHQSNETIIVAKPTVETKPFQRAFDEPQSSPEHKSIPIETPKRSHGKHDSNSTSTTVVNRKSSGHKTNSIPESDGGSIGGGSRGSSGATTPNRTKFNTQMNSSSITHSNSELNSVCPHGKGSNKSELVLFTY